MRKTIFIFILGCIAGAAYVQHDGFREWADDSFEIVKEKAVELFDMAKDGAEEKLEDAKDSAKDTLEDKYSSFSTKIEEEADKVKEASDSVEKE